MPTPSAEPPAPPEEKPDTWFWDLLREIPTQQWGSRSSVMIWRDSPKVPGVPGAKGFLCEVFEPITPSWVKERYGGGKFRCILLKDSRFQTTHIFDIEGAPKYDLSRENPYGVAGHAGNNGNGDKELLQQFVGVLRDELQRAREANSAPPGTDRVVELLTTASEKAMEIVTKQAPGHVDSTQQLANLVNIVKGMMPQPQENGLLTTMLKPLVEKMLTPVDPMAQVTMFLTIFEKLDALRGGGDSGGKPKDWRAMLAEGLVQKGPELLKEVRETLQVNAETARERHATAQTFERVEQLRRTSPTNVPANGTAPAAAAPNPAQPSAMPAPGPLRTVPINHGTEPQAAPAPSATAAAAAPAAPGMSSSESDAVANFMKRRIVEMVEEGRDPEDVVDFIEDVDASTNNLLAQYSPEVVTTFLEADPILARATKHPHWLEFLTAAQAYIKEIRAEDAAEFAAKPN